MTFVLYKPAMVPVRGKDLTKAVETLNYAVNMLGRSFGDESQSAVRLGELLQLGIVKMGPDGQLQTEVIANLEDLKTAGSGVYTPTLAGVANIANGTASPAQWLRVGQVVTVSGRLDIVTTAAANTQTQIGISLPFPSALAASGECAGVINGSTGTLIEPGTIAADITNDRANAVWYSTQTASHAFIYQFTYSVK